MWNEKAKEILESREHIGHKLIRNLREYGTLAGKDGIPMRPYHDRSHSVYPFTGINYLRILADGQANDARWYSEQDIRKAGLTLKEGAKVVYLEQWSKLSQGEQGITGRLVPFVSAQDLLNAPKQTALELDTIAGFDRGTACLRQAEADTGRTEFLFPGGKEDLFYRLANACREQLLQQDEDNLADYRLTPKFAACIAFREYGLSLPFYDNNPMLNAEELEILKGKDGPKRLFHAFGKASTIFRQWQEHQLEHTDKFRHEGPGEHFQGLRVTLYYSTLPELTEGENTKLQVVASGQSAPEKRPAFPPGTYTNENAYELLRRMMEVDKQLWEDGLGKDPRRSLTKIALDYKGYHWRDAVLRLGTLEFGNERLVREALDQRVTAKMRYDIDNPNRLRQELFRYNRSMSDNAAAVESELSRLREGICLWRKCSSSFAKEEQAYLSRLPEELRYQKRAPTYLYVCHSLSSAPDCDRSDGILHVYQGIEHFPGLRTKLLGMRRKTCQESDIIIEADRPLRYYQPVYTQEDQESFAKLRDFSLQFRRGNGSMREVCGPEAIEKFLQYKCEDATLASFPHEQAEEIPVTLSFCHKGKSFYDITYEEGSGDLNRALPDGMPHIRNPSLDASFQKSVRTWARHHNQNAYDGCSLLYQKTLLPAREVKQNSQQEERASPERAAGMGR